MMTDDISSGQSYLHSSIFFLGKEVAPFQIWTMHKMLQLQYLCPQHLPLYLKYHFFCQVYLHGSLNRKSCNLILFFAFPKKLLKFLVGGTARLLEGKIFLLPSRNIKFLFWCSASLMDSTTSYLSLTKWYSIALGWRWRMMLIFVA